MRNAVFAALVVVTATARAQGVDRRYVEEPTEGLALPMVPLAGEHDARSVAANPGGLALLRGTELALVLDIEDPDIATSAGPGVGAYAAMVVGVPLLPRFAVGLGAEWLRPSRAQLAPDPGEPFRFTFALATAIGKHAGLGFSWHTFRHGGALDGITSVDLGLSTRWGSHLAIGAALRDVATTPVNRTEVQRRYELEAVLRPLAHDALELAIGGRIGETKADVDGWARLSARLTRGFTVHLGAETRELHALAGPLEMEVEGRDVRAMLGLELSFGKTGVTTIATGLRDDAGDNHFLGGQLVLRSSGLGPPSVLGPSDHLERVELNGTIGLRELTSLVARLRAIARDSTAKGLVVTFDGASGGWATLEELRNEILLVKKAGKKVFAYMVSGTGRDYFIATAADKIYVDPAGGVRLVGMAASTLFFKGAFDALGVLPQFEKIAEYKSAPESFIQTGPSETAAKMQNDLLDSLWDRWVTAVAEARKLSKDEVKAIVDNGPYTAGDLAKDTKLVDAVGGPDKVAQLVASEMGAIYPVSAPPAERPDRWTRPAIALIYVDGDIVDGKSRTIPILGQKLVGSETLVAAISAARANPKIGAIILRIDTPGGSALASELISREVFATRGTKPILCSLSDVAASGGYFIAAGCELIYAEPMTITGSIGIFYGKFDVSGLASKLGVTTASYKRGARADVESYFRAYTDEERLVLLDKLRYMYGRFVGAVAEGRGMKKEDVDAVGRGHVYTGDQAKPIKLVDRFGGLGDVLDEAKRQMKLAPGTRVQLVELPAVSTSLLGQLGGLLGLRAEESVSITDLPAIRDLLLGVPASLLASPDGAQARLPYQLIWD
jgi:protease-4